MSSNMYRSPAHPWSTHVGEDPSTPTAFAFFHPQSSSWQYIVADNSTGAAVIIDPALDFDQTSNTVSTGSADALLTFVQSKRLNVSRILETHIHTDHLSAAQYLKRALGPHVIVCIGRHAAQVQDVLAPAYGIPRAELNGTFDRLFRDGEEFAVGSLTCKVAHLPGHTPEHVAYLCGRFVFSGDVISLPDVGSTRVDFPGGSASALYTSIRRLLVLPRSTRLFVGHDFPPHSRAQACSTTVAEQRAANIHVREGTSEEAFSRMRTERDRRLGEPRLFHQSVQTNIRAGHLPRGPDGRVLFRVR